MMKDIDYSTVAIQIELLTDILGTVPKDKEVYRSFIAQKARELSDAEEEVETVEEIEERAWTGFHSDEKGLFLYNYMIKGFLKNACEVLMANGAIPKIAAYKKWIDNLVFIEPRKIYLGVKEPEGVLERPLRAMTAKGPRVSLQRSDVVKAGKVLVFKLVLLKNNKGLTLDALSKCLEFGKFMGLAQWRSADYGRFSVVSVRAV
jgi:hypothetical protein